MNIQEVFSQYYDYWLNIITEFTKTDFFHQFSLAVIFFVASLPLIPLPNEVVTTPSLALGVNPIFIVMAVGFGGYFGDIVLFYIGRNLRKITSKDHKKILEAEHFIHREGLLIYLATPSLFFGIGDLIVLLSGHQGVSFIKMTPFLLAGNFLRGTWGILVSMGLLQIPSFLQF